MPQRHEAGAGVSAKLKTPFADLLPPLASAEFDALKASIKRDGVRDPIVVDDEGNILDGHHRHKIKADAPRTVLKGLSEGQKAAFVLASNLQRRNLSPDQKAELRKRQQEVAAMLKAEGARQEEIATRLVVDQTTVSRWLTPNMQQHKGRKKEESDCRIKLMHAAKVEITKRIDAGEPQAQVAADYGVSQQQVSKVAKAERKHREREAELEVQRKAIESGQVEISKAKFDVLVYDPPWPYDTEYESEGRRAASPYPEMSLEAIRQDFHGAADDCVLWLWTTHKFMRESFPLLDAWGFEDKQILTWVKDRMGLGRWLRSQSEFCIMAVRGKPRIMLTNQTTVIRGALREHSRKPDEFYTLVDSLCPGTKYDRFAREPRNGWIIGGSVGDRFAA